MPQTMETTIPSAKELKTWAETFPPEDGLFEEIFTDREYEFPEWVGISYIEMDQLAWAQFGYRPISLIVHKYKERYGTTYWKRDLASAVWGLYHKKWEKMITLANLQYDPIHNFSDTIHEEIDTAEDESITDDIDKTSIHLETRDLVASRLSTLSGTKENTGTVNNTRTDNLHQASGDTTALEGQSSQQDNIYGFNSPDVVGDTTHGGSSSTNTTESHSVDNTGTQTVLRTDNTMQSDQSTNQTTDTDAGTVSHNVTDTDDRSRVRDLDGTRVRDVTRSGNIGNLSTQALIQEEIKLWRWKFIQEMLDDVRDFGTLPIYV